MRGLQKSKRVSWASDVNLFQVKLFLSDESPSQVAFSAQDHLQAKASWLPKPTGMGSDDNLPPGFEEAHPANLLKNKLSQIPLIKWRCPPRFVLDFTWQVVAGEESKEVEIQNKREMGVLEAVYPRLSNIPPSPSVLMGIEDSPHDDDLNTLVIPITHIEDEDAAGDTSVDTMAHNPIHMCSQAPILAPGMLPASKCITANSPSPTANGNAAAGMFLGVKPEVAAAAYTALKTSNDQGNLVDPGLLIKILSDPKLTERLITDHRAATNPQIIPKQRSAGIILSEPPPVQMSRTEAGAPFLAASPNGLLYTPPNRVGPPVPNPHPPPPEVLSVPSPPVGAPVAVAVAKDINYYKSLIQQHGGERQANLPQFGSPHSSQLEVNNPKTRDSKPKIMKPCIYFNSSRGCRNGANCSYQHDGSSQQRADGMSEVQSAKRMKLDREITGS